MLNIQGRPIWVRRNIHIIERVFRIAVGLFFGLILFFQTYNSWFLLGWVLVITGVAGWCPFYQMFRISTCPKNEIQKPELHDRDVHDDHLQSAH